MAIIDPTDIAIQQSALSGWWPGERGMMEGVAAGSALPFKWKSFKDLQAFSPYNVAKPPILANDNVIKKDYLQLGYGGSLTKETLTAVAVRLVSGGSGYVNGEVLTLQNGVQVKVENGGHIGGVIQSTTTSYTMVNPGTIAAKPAGAITQVSSTGAGTGATFIVDFFADNGSLLLSPFPSLITAATPTFSYVVAFRCPVVGGVAGADPGGFIFGSQLNQTDYLNSLGGYNVRLWGLRVGHPQFGAGRLVAHVGGDANYNVGAVGTDYRDGQWHVAMATHVAGAAGSCKLYVDGVLVSSNNAVLATLNATYGSELLRVGAAGLPNIPPTGGAALDIGAIAIVPLDLNNAANAALRQTIGNRFLAQWRLGGGHA